MEAYKGKRKTSDERKPTGKDNPVQAEMEAFELFGEQERVHGRDG